MANLELVEKVISCLLDASEEKEEFRSRIRILELYNQISEGRLSGVEYALSKIVNNLYRIRIGTGEWKISVSKEELYDAVMHSIKTLVYEKEFDIEGEIQRNGLAFNMKIPKDVEDVISLYYGKILESVDSIYSQLEVSVTAALTCLDNIKTEALDELYRTSILEQSRVYNEKGLEAATLLQEEYNYKASKLKAVDVLGENPNGTIRLKSYEEVQRLRARNKGRRKNLFFMGIAPYDKKFSITNEDIVVVVAAINTGKTRLCVDQAYKCIAAGNNCTIISTETKPAVIERYLSLMHFYYMFGYTNLSASTLEALEGLDDGDPEKEKYRYILEQYECASADLYNNPKYGKFSLSERISYEGCLDFFKKEKQVNGSDMIFIDHIRDLNHEGKTPDGRVLRDQKESLAYLSMCMKIAVTVYNIGFFAFSHPRSEYSDTASSKKINTTTNITAGATEVSESATRMFYMNQTLDQIAGDMVCIHESKTRTESKDMGGHVLVRLGYSNVHIYDESFDSSGNEELESYEDLVD